MRILLVAPRAREANATPAWLRIPQMSLLILEALSGNGHHVVIVEEDADSLPLTEKWDLVGITVMTATAPRAYALAKMFRERGARVILGGIHPSVLPEEASQHADAVLVGEAEAIWRSILKDAEHGSLQRIYSSLRPETIEIPLVNYKNRAMSRAPTLTPVIASRGCPNGCEFCSVPGIYGNRPRQVPISQVIEQVQRSRGEYIAFLDDNLAATREYALELFAALRSLKVKILAQVSVRFILDDELFEMALAAGLKGIFVGFETIEERSCARLRKLLPVHEYGIAIQKCGAAGVMLHGSFIFGLDEHDKTIFARTLDFVMRHKMFSVNANVMTPYPGTPFFDRMVSEGRLLHRNWAFYDHATPVFQPARMTVEDLAEGYTKFRVSLLSLRGIARRLPAGMPVNLYVYFNVIAAFRRTTAELKEHYKNYFRWLQRLEGC